MSYRDKPKPRKSISDHAFSTGIDSYYYQSGSTSLTWDPPSTAWDSHTTTFTAADLNSVFSEVSGPTTMTVTCLICSDEHEVPYDKANLGMGVCELCRQAVLLCRRQVLEQMARDLAEMSDD